MNVLLATAYPTRWNRLPQFRWLAAADRVGRHALTDDPDEADVILFVDARAEHGDWRFRALTRHPLARRYREKAFVYNECDQPWCVMPGLYPSMPAGSFRPRRQRAWCLVGSPNPLVAEAAAAFDAAGRGPDLLFSFQGRRLPGWRVRDAVLALRHARGVVEDRSGYNFFGDANRPAPIMEAARRDYARTLARSKFVLCPRGSGPSSFRLFEALRAGRVPVILSDEWVEPAGPNWTACSLRVPERRAAELPVLLEAAEPRWPAMAAAAREVWSDWFADDVLFHRTAEACLDLRRRRRVPERVARHVPTRRWVRLWARDLKARLCRPRPAAPPATAKGQTAAP